MDKNKADRISDDLSHLLNQEFDRLAKGNATKHLKMILAYSEVAAICMELLPKETVPDFLRVIANTVEVAVAEYKREND